MPDNRQNMSHSDKSQNDSDRHLNVSDVLYSESPHHHPPHHHPPHHRSSHHRPPHHQQPHPHPPHHHPPHHQPPHHHLPHHHPPHHHRRDVIGLNSLLAETLKELLPTFKDIDTIASVVRELDGDASPIFTRVSEEGITNPVAFVERFLEIEASERMDVRNCMLSDIRQSLAIVLFPLPPYIIELVRPVLNRRFSFNTTEHPPVHIQRDNFSFLDYEKIQQLFGITHDMHSLVLDGMRFQNTLAIRPNAASVLELLLAKSLNRLYFHKIPHLPHGERFITLDMTGYDVEIRCI